MPSNHQIIATISAAMPSPLRDGHDALIKVKDLFPEAKNQATLILEEVDFFRLGPSLVRFDFSGCVFKKCSFDHLTIEGCIFDDAEIRKNNRFEDCFVASDNCGLLLVKESKLESSHVSISGHLVDADREGRKIRCWQKRCRQYPEDFLNYYKVLGNKEPYSPMINDSDFCYFDFPGADLSHYGEGWKLHVSVDRETENMRRAFDLLVPYLAKREYHFKFTTPNIEKSGRLHSNAQFTIYLTTHSENEEHIPVEQVNKMIDEITKLFYEHNIRAVEKPRSDESTGSLYFSLRNDKLYLPSCFIYSAGDSKMSQVYISASQSRGHFNPCRNPNPYKKLLKNYVDPPFDLLDHFLIFQLTKKSDRSLALNALMYTMVAYLREYTLADKLEIKEAFAFKSQCVRNDLEVDEKFIKKDFQKNPDIRKGIKIACSILDYLCCDNDRELIALVPEFSSYFPQGGDFLKKLREIEKIMALTSEWHEYEEVYSFQEHMKFLQPGAVASELERGAPESCL